jgi:potassium channel subfamily K
VVILKTATSAVATVFLRHNFTLNHIIYKVPWFFSHLPDWMQRRIENREAERTLSNGVAIGDETAISFSKSFSRDEAYAAGTKEPNISELADQREKDVAGKGPDAGALARQLALAIRRASRDNIKDPEKQYTFEEWVEFIRLIRFSAVDGAKPAAPRDEDEGMTEWDWLAENSPMMSEKGEAEFVLERLCESLVRYLRRNPPHEVFETNLREVGESALRLKVHADLEDDGPGPRGEEAVQAPPAAQANSGAQATPAPSVFRTADFSLHPVKEEDHDTRAAKKDDEIGAA